MLRKVYVATEGAYSDFSIVGAFLNKEDAEACPLADGYEEFVLNDGPMDLRYYYTAVYHGRYGRARQAVMRDELREYDGNDEVHLTTSSWSGPPTFMARGWDQLKVLKVVSDARAAFLAEREGVA
jgi:hypothetical protein